VIDYEKFESSRNYEVPSDLRSLPGPIAGYVGAIGKRLTLIFYSSVKDQFIKNEKF
jgi:hypothetical protein